MPSIYDNLVVHMSSMIHVEPVAYKFRDTRLVMVD